MRVLLKKDPRYHLDLRWIRREVEKLFAELGIHEGEVSLIFVGRRKAKALNQQYRQMDYVPLVLSFPQGGEYRAGRRVWGDVMICWPEVREQAIRENATLEEILTQLLKHGLANLAKSLVK